MTELLCFVLALIIGVSIGRSLGSDYTRTSDIGEARVADSIRGLDLPLYHLINNVTIPTSNGTTQIDHILITDAAVFVIETKHYRGWIFGGPNHKQWTQTIYRRKSKFQNPSFQNYRHIEALREFFKLSSEAFVNLVVFSGDATFKTDLGKNVILLKDLHPYLRAFRPAQFDERKVSYIVGRIEMRRLQRSVETDEYHVSSLGFRHRKSA